MDTGGQDESNSGTINVTSSKRSGGVGSVLQETVFSISSFFFKYGAVGALTPWIVIGFVGVSALATGKGILDLLTVARPDLTEGNLPWFYIAPVVALASVSMWAALELTLRTQSIAHRLLALFFYLFLTLWSLGFGYGFWWSLLAGREETQIRLQAMEKALVEPVMVIGAKAATVESSVAAIGTDSLQRQTQESERGGSCDNARNSPLGYGPLARERYALTQSIDRVTARVGSDWVEPMGEQKAELETLRTRVASFRDTANANQLTRSSYDTIKKDAEAISLEISSLYQSVVPALQSELRDLAIRMDPSLSATVCTDAVLFRRLSALADELNEAPPEISVPALEYVNGAYATAYAFDRLWKSVFAVAGSATMAPAPGKATLAAAGAPEVKSASNTGPSQNDLVALVAAIVVELGILVFTVISPRRPFEQADFARRARGPVQERLLSAFQSFGNDDKIEARATIDDLLLHTGSRRVYLISPSFKSGLQSAGAPRSSLLEHKRRFIQNVLIVLEEARAIDRTVRMGPLRRLLAKSLPWLQTSRLFVEAEERLLNHGWNVRDEGDFRLHRIRRAELLEVLMMLREQIEKNETETAIANKPPKPRRSRARKPSLMQLFRLGRDDDDAWDDDEDDTNDEEFYTRSRRTRRNARSGRGDGDAHGSSRREDRRRQAPAGNTARDIPSVKLRASEETRAHQINEAADSEHDTQAIIDEVDVLTYQALSLENAPGAQERADKAKSEDIVRKLIAILNDRGFSAVPTTGMADPAFHNVVQEVPSSLPRGTILRVTRHGFVNQSGNLSRAADVVVSSGQQEDVDEQMFDEV